MRFIVLRASVSKEGALILQALTTLTHKPSGITDSWIDLADATTNCLEPEKCDILSFDDKDQLEQDLELWGVAAENIAIIGVDAG